MPTVTLYPTAEVQAGWNEVPNATNHATILDNAPHDPNAYVYIGGYSGGLVDELRFGTALPGTADVVTRIRVFMWVNSEAFDYFPGLQIQVLFGGEIIGLLNGIINSGGGWREYVFTISGLSITKENWENSGVTIRMNGTGPHADEQIPTIEETD